jgi:hypothetical protein
VLRNLLDVVPAGLEDLAAVSVLTDALVQERFKRIVVDPVASSTGVRLLEVPELARTWLTNLLSVLVKYRSKGLGELADEAAALLKHVKRFEEAVVNPAEARFVVVTRGEELQAARTERIVEELQGKKLAVERVLVNRVLPQDHRPRRRGAASPGAQRGQGPGEEDRPHGHRRTGPGPLSGRPPRAEVLPHRLVRAHRDPGQDAGCLGTPTRVAAPSFALDFERPLLELERKIDELKSLSGAARVISPPRSRSWRRRPGGCSRRSSVTCLAGR